MRGWRRRVKVKSQCEEVSEIKGEIERGRDWRRGVKDMSEKERNEKGEKRRKRETATHKEKEKERERNMRHPADTCLV